MDSVPIDRALADVNYTRLAPIENEWQTFYPLGAIFETVHMEAPPPQKFQGGPLTSVRVSKETTTGPLRRLQVMLLHPQHGGVLTGGGRGGRGGRTGCICLSAGLTTASNSLPVPWTSDLDQVLLAGFTDAESLAHPA